MSKIMSQEYTLRQGGSVTTKETRFYKTSRFAKSALTQFKEKKLITDIKFSNDRGTDIFQRINGIMRLTMRIVNEPRLLYDVYSNSYCKDFTSGPSCSTITITKQYNDLSPKQYNSIKIYHAHKT